MTKTATISLHSNAFEVDAALVGSSVEVVFDPFDLASVEIRFQGRSMGSGIPVTIGRHSHPQARPEAAPAPAPTGIDYLGLLADRREAEQARSINYSELALPGFEGDPDTDRHHTTPPRPRRPSHDHRPPPGPLGVHPHAVHQGPRPVHAPYPPVPRGSGRPDRLVRR